MPNLPDRTEKENKMGFFEGFIAALAALSVAAFITGAALAVQEDSIAEHCNDFGKTKLNDEFYECHKIGE